MTILTPDTHPYFWNRLQPLQNDRSYHLMHSEVLNINDTHKDNSKIIVNHIFKQVMRSIVSRETWNLQQGKMFLDLPV